MDGDTLVILVAVAVALLAALGYFNRRNKK